MTKPKRISYEHKKKVKVPVLPTVEKLVLEIYDMETAGIQTHRDLRAKLERTGRGIEENFGLRSNV